MTANPNCLRSVCEEVKYPVAQCGTQAQSGFMPEIVLNAELKTAFFGYFQGVEGSEDGIFCGSVGSECKLIQLGSRLAGMLSLMFWGTSFSKHFSRMVVSATVQ